MKKALIKTSTSGIRSLGLRLLGYGGEYATEAWEVLGGYNLPDTPNAWADIMVDNEGKLYAVWSEDALSCDYCDAAYIELDRQEYPGLYEVMRSNIEEKKDLEQERYERQLEYEEREAEKARILREIESGEREY